ncbi:MAG TPA: permease prefix domain 1-containing protein [Candidatus Angelobacter sp.]|nr:permease prefix domain 1-containing protein [Candidatus Angelobacter sp.]
METQTRFDLNASIARWQQELASQPDLVPVVRRELETHLRDTIAELQARGLNNEESFWLARRRVGRPQQLSEEFAKADPAQVWRERTFWMAAGLLLVNLWGTFFNQFFMNRGVLVRERLQDLLPGWVSFYLPNWLREFPGFIAREVLLQLVHFAPVVVIAILLATGRLKYGRTAFQFVFGSRTRFVLAAIIAYLAAHAYALFFPQPFQLGEFIVLQSFWAFSLIALVAWLIPSNRKMANAAV